MLRLCGPKPIRSFGPSSLRGPSKSRHESAELSLDQARERDRQWREHQRERIERLHRRVHRVRAFLIRVAGVFTLALLALLAQAVLLMLLTSGDWAGDARVELGALWRWTLTGMLGVVATAAAGLLPVHLYQWCLAWWVRTHLPGLDEPTNPGTPF